VLLTPLALLKSAPEPLALLFTPIADCCHRNGQQNAFRRRGARPQPRSFALLRLELIPSPSSNRLYGDCRRWVRSQARPRQLRLSSVSLGVRILAG
jgi:hypothetical protein